MKELNFLTVKAFIEGRRWLADDHSKSLLPNRLFSAKCLRNQVKLVLFIQHIVLRDTPQTKPSNNNHLSLQEVQGVHTQGDHQCGRLAARGVTIGKICMITIRKLQKEPNPHPNAPGDVEDALKEASHQTWKTCKGSNP